MKKWFIIITALILLGIIGGIAGYFFIYNKPHVNYEKAAAEHSLTGQQLFLQFRDSRAVAEQSYNGKVLEVEGLVSSVETPDSLTIVVFVLDEGMFGEEGIRFTMLDAHSERARSLNPGEVVTIKGYCTGYNETDVILEKCSIIE